MKPRSKLNLGQVAALFVPCTKQIVFQGFKQPFPNSIFTVFGHKIIHVVCRQCFSTVKQQLLVLFRSQTSVGVRHLDTELLGALNNLLALLAANGVTDLGRIRSVLHEQHFEVLDVVDENLDETVRADVLALLVATITDVRHQVLTLVATSHAIVDTLWLSPAWP